MKNTLRAALPLAPLALLAGPPLSPFPGADDLAFGPGRYSVLGKSFTEDTRLQVDSMEMVAEGGVVPEEELPDVTLEVSRRVGITDEYLGITDGRIDELHRTYDELFLEAVVELDLDGAIEAHTATSRSELEDSTVSFIWNEAEEVHDVAFEEGATGVEEHLAGLVLDADLRGLLPTKAVAEGDEWSVDPEVLETLLNPGGDPWLIPEDFGEAPFLNLDLYVMVAATLSALGDSTAGFEGEVTAKYLGTEEVDGLVVGRIGLEVEVTAEADRLERFLLAAEGAGVEMEFESLSYSWSIIGRGELAWDLENGHFHALELEADLGLEADLAWQQPIFDGEIRLEGSYELSGSTRVTAGVETE